MKIAHAKREKFRIEPRQSPILLPRSLTTTGQSHCVLSVTFSRVLSDPSHIELKNKIDRESNIIYFWNAVVANCHRRLRIYLSPTSAKNNETAPMNPSSDTSADLQIYLTGSGDQWVVG